MFKEKYYYFFPTNDLVKSMPFDFVNSLKDGKWTKLENKWLNDVKKTLKQAVSNSIKDVKFARTIMKDDLPFTESNLLNKENDHIYQVTLDNESQSKASGKALGSFPQYFWHAAAHMDPV